MSPEEMRPIGDARTQGVAYGYVEVPKKGVTIDGVQFPPGPRAAGKSGWFRLLIAAGCTEITQVEYEQRMGITPKDEPETPKLPKPTTRPPQATDKKEAGDAVPQHRRRGRKAPQDPV